MNHICQHCGELIVGNAYRVTSEEEGITLLNMVVCSLCSMEAKRLRLHTEEITIRTKDSSAQSQGSQRSPWKLPPVLKKPYG
jgi:RNase P subunit RPR2